MADNLKALVRERALIKTQMTRLQTCLKTRQLDLHDLQIRKVKLEELYKEFNRVQLAVDIAQDKDDEDPAIVVFEDQYYECARIISKSIQELSNLTSLSSVSTHSPENLSSTSGKSIHTILPKIEIQPFDGNPIEWHSFHDTFRSLVHENEDLPAVQKFHYLKNLLRGEMTTIIASLNASEENYLVAWDLLQKRCNRPRQIIQAHLKSLFQLPEITRDSPANLRTLIERAEMHVKALHALNQPTQSWDAFLVYIIAGKLDKNTRRIWERSLENDEMPSFKNLLEFLTKQARGDEIETHTLTSNKQTYSDRQASNKQFPYSERQTRSKTLNRNHQSYVSSQPQCGICKQAHAVYACPDFLKLSTRDRAEAARKANLCMNCLRTNHNTFKCTSLGCRICKKRHNTLLHFIDSNPQNTSVGSSNAVTNFCSTPVERRSEIQQNKIAVENSTTVAKGSYHSSACDSEVLLGTARVLIFDKHNQPHHCRVLLDSGSQTHFITERLAERLNLPRNHVDIAFAGLGQKLTNTQHTLKATIKSMASPFESELTFVVLPTITGLLPARQIDRRNIQIPQNVKLADPDFHKSVGVDALIGNALFYSLLCIGQIKTCNNSVVLQRTRLGWIVTGEINLSNQRQEKIIRKAHLATTLENQITKFWEIEQIPDRKHFSKEELECEEHYRKNTQRDINGRYVVSLPFKSNKDQLGDSYKVCLKRFCTLERRLSRNSNIAIQYSDFLNEYLRLDHMSDITDTDNTNLGFYLPHHAVTKESSLTTKIRVVFDGSATTSSQIALNDTLMVGPTIQDDLISIIMRFRTHRYVLTADIEKMFRQIRVTESDAYYQKILWRESSDAPLKTYKLDTVTYGTACAPFLAVRTLQQLVKDEGHAFPLGAVALTNDFYVDDMLTGADTFENAMQLREQITHLLKLGGFNLRQWSSNEPQLINSLEQATDSQFLLLDSSKTKRVLGIHWNAASDSISYSVQSPANSERITKRTILSNIAQLFDPLGLLGPVIVRAKIIMQQLWKENLSWDETVPPHIYSNWCNFKGELPILNNFNITRRIIINDPYHIQLHGFCDASEGAYGACIYLRSTDRNNKHFVRLVCAKSRVAPIKTISLPRLELCAATLLAKLYKASAKAIRVQFAKVKFWTDSTIVLSWIHSSPHVLKTFVANRVTEIQTLTEVEDWGHVASQDNPADHISRGQLPNEFINNEHWVLGPNWLSNDESDWPKVPTLINNVPERRTKISLVTQTNTHTFFEEFSSIIKLNRFVAYCLRSLGNRRTRVKTVGELTVQQINEAHMRVIKLIQHESFALTINDLKSGRELNKKDKLLPLDPFLDQQGILRVGGRLRNAIISYAQKHPMLLPKAHHVTNIIIMHEHNKYWHSGVQGTLNAIRQKYWLVDGRNVVRRVIHNCIRCRKANPVATNYTMGNLPENRIRMARPFENVGIDYCGPFFIKEKKFRNTKKIKAYVAIFVCFCTKAVHLELVTELTTEACLAAIRRFFSRRGKAKNIYTDNGTNFIGASNEIKQLQKHLLSEAHNKQITHSLANEGVSWHFSPPRSAHFGGLWEAAVKSFKGHLYVTIGETLFTYEQFNTCIIEIEAILNSRPITPLSTDPNDLSALTPSHFLIGDTLKTLPEYALQEIATNKLSAYQHVQQIKQHFWSRWHKEYLNQLHTRSKWHQKGSADIKIGTLVTIREDKQPPLQWIMGRIIAVHPGADGIVRVATVKTSKGTYKRSVKLLCPLPIETAHDRD